MSRHSIVYNPVTGKFEVADFGVGTTNPLVSESGTQTLTNKTLTAPTLTSPTLTDPTITGTTSLGAGATLTSPTLVTPTFSGASTGFRFPVTEYDADGAIAIATGIVALISTDAGLYTLAAPSAGQAGVFLIITSKTAAAHVITATNLINDGVGPTLDTITFDAQPGASIQLVAYNLLWYVVSQNATTATAGA